MKRRRKTMTGKQTIMMIRRWRSKRKTRIFKTMNKSKVRVSFSNTLETSNGEEATAPRLHL